MNNKKTKSIVIITTLTLMLFIAGGLVVRYLQSYRQLTVHFSDAQSLVLIDSSTTQDTNHIEDITIPNSHSPQTVRVPVGRTFFLLYKGNEGYADGDVLISSGDSSVEVIPEYSQERYQSIINDSLKAIESVLIKEYPKFDQLYSVKDSRARNRGQWIAMILEYKGDDSRNSDDLRVLFKMVDGEWSLAAGPDIVLSSTKNPNIDLDILNWSNSF